MKKISVLSLGLLALGFSSETQPMPGCRLREIPVINATLNIPEGWAFDDLSQGKERSVFEVTPSGPGFSGPVKSRYRLEIYFNQDKKTIVEKARQFVTASRTRETKDAQPFSMQTTGKMQMFSLVVEFPSKGKDGRYRSIARWASANPVTGTLMKVNFDIAEEEVEQVALLGNYLFRNMVLDDEY
jgi:hypothetical protein